jgi:hypothetical protein
MYGAGSLSAVLCEIEIIRREIPPSLDAEIQADGGWVPFDILETPFGVGTGTAAEQRFALPLPGWYAGLLMRHYKGGSSVTRADISETVTAGSETKWRIESGQATIREWRNKYLKGRNDRSRPLNTHLQATSPSIGGTPLSNSFFGSDNSLYHDFLSDNGDAVMELGSLLDCNIPQGSNLKMEIVMTPSNVATNGHTLYVMGHRFYDDDSHIVKRWQVLKKG